MLSPADQVPRGRRASRHRGGRGRPREARRRLCGPRARVAHRGRAAAESRVGAKAGVPPSGCCSRTGMAGRCAERLCVMQDEIIRMLFDLTVQALSLRPCRPMSSAWRWSRPAATAAACWRPAPTSISCSCFPTSRPPGVSPSPRRILYCLWDMGLKVGHATRSIDECIRQAKADMTIRTALLEARHLLGDRALFDEFVARFDKDVVQGTAAQFVAAKLAEREERLRRAGQSRYLVEPNVKDGKGGLRDRAHAVLDRQIRLSRPRARRADRSGRVRPRGVQAVPPLPRTSSGRCAVTCIS